MNELRKREGLLRKTADTLHTEPEQLLAIIGKFQRELGEARKGIEKLKGAQ